MKHCSILLFLLVLPSMLSCTKEKAKQEKRIITPLNEPYPGLGLDFASNESKHVICVIGDTGTNWQILMRSALRLRRAGCDEIRHTGDIIYPRGLRSRRDPKFQLLFMKPFGHFLKKKIPIFLSLGNHDYYGNPSVWPQIAKREKYIIFPSSYYITRYNFGLCAITLDSMRNLKMQRKWLEDLYSLDFVKSCRRTFFFMHHPLYNEGHHGEAEGELRSIYKDFVVGKAAAAFAGHEHITSYEEEEQGTHFFISGSFSQIYPNGRTDEAVVVRGLGFIKVIIDTAELQNITVQLHKLDRHLTQVTKLEIPALGE